MKKIFFLLFITVKYLLLPVNIYSQRVAINNDGTQPDSRAILDVKSSNKVGLLPFMASLHTEGQPHDLFGSNVSISEDYAIVGEVGYGDVTN